jgi:lipopolysaccharide transport system ATP-binding protein
MSSDVVVRATNVSKRFKIYNSPWDRARDWVTFGRRAYHTDFWALKDVSFELRKGEALGIMGQNGAGKSTLLKILNGAMFATSGNFQINGRVLSMLELGTGFNPELTGRQNIYNSAHLLGFPNNYVAERIDNIEDFAEIGDFFERPIKMYSSGMHARLAFSMFAFLDCDLLIIDEVLAVGDTFFTQKCYERLDQLRAQDTAMIMVTHNMSVIQQYCQHALVLDKGRVTFAGSASEATIHYFFSSNAPKETSQRAKKDARRSQLRVPQLTGSIIKHSPSETSQHGNQDWAPGQIYWPTDNAFLEIKSASLVGEGWARCTALSQRDDNGQPCQLFRAGQRVHWYYEFEALQDLYELSGVITILNEKNIRVHGKNTVQLGVRSKHPLLKGMRARFHQSVVLNLTSGEYTFGVGLSAAEGDGPVFAEKSFLACNIVRAGTFHIVPPAGPHLGLCDLPGECEVELCSSTYLLTPDLAIPG